MPRTSSQRVLGVFSLAMINVALIASLRGLPLMAKYGLSLIFFLLAAALIFFIPAALVSAELATGWPQKGGIYLWVKQALGDRFGFLAIWLQWIQNIIFYPTALATTAAVFAYLFTPVLAQNKYYTLAVIIVVYWGATLLNLQGMKISGLVSSIGAIGGILVPGALIILAGIVWLIIGNPSQITFSVQNVFPDFTQVGSIAFFLGILLFFAGIEVSAVHAKEVKNPARDYPKAIFLSAAIIITLFILGALSIAIIVPQSEISLTAGLIETFRILFNKFNIPWMTPIIILLIVPGLITQVSSWIPGPSKGLLATAEDGSLPRFFQKTNKHKMPINIFIVQGCIVTLISLTFLLMPTVSSSFWILTALAAQLYLAMYILMFISAIVLRYKKPKVKRPYKIPGGNFGMWFVAGTGILGAVGSMIVGCFPPTQLKTGSFTFYISFLLVGILTMIVTPFIIYSCRKPSWKPKKK